MLGGYRTSTSFENCKLDTIDNGILSLELTSHTKKKNRMAAIASLHSTATRQTKRPISSLRISTI